MRYQVLKNRLTNGKPFAAEVAVARINALADALEITQDEANELLALAAERGTAEATTMEERLAALEAASLEHDTALMELAALLAGGDA